MKAMNDNIGLEGPVSLAVVFEEFTQVAQRLKTATKHPSQLT